MSAVQPAVVRVEAVDALHLVLIHVVGGGEPGSYVLTPAEARAIAGDLSRAANRAGRAGPSGRDRGREDRRTRERPGRALDSRR